MSFTVKETVQSIKNELSEIYPSHEAFQMAWLIFEHLYGWSKTDLMLHNHTKLTDSDHLIVQKVLERLKMHEPIQYILGQTEFYGLPIQVNSSVLIPRPETEELVEWVIQTTSEQRSADILDIGTGSGCIAIALAKRLPNAQIHACDISEKALQTAAKNAEINQVKINFGIKDILNPSSALNDPSMDIIVSNPPYVRDSEKKHIQPHVLEYEPHLALFVKDSDPLIFYRAIALYAKTQLKKNGKLFFEINSAFGKEIQGLLIQNGFKNVELRDDLSGKCRMIKADKPLR